MDLWILLSNIALVVVTALAVGESWRDATRHEEKETALVLKIVKELQKEGDSH